jgi:hypothetical protein
MLWPEFLVVLDDEDTSVSSMTLILKDLSWLENPRHFLTTHGLISEEHLIKAIEDEVKSRPQQLTNLTNPNVLRDRVVGVNVDSPNQVQKAIDHLQRSGPAIAFIDFSYSQAPSAQARLVELYNNECPQEWIIHQSDLQKGGCFFAASFKPGVGQPVRLLCPTTQNPPDFLDKAAGGAVTRHVGLQGGGANMMRAVLFALRKWIELQSYCPLDEIWEGTKEWFRSDDGDSGQFSPYNMPHTFPMSPNLDSYRQTFEEMFRLKTPAAWWTNSASVHNIHESLKHLCGAFYCGTEKAVDHKYNLSTGACYIVLLLALRDTNSQSCDKLTSDVKTFEGLDHANYTIFPRQEPQIAKDGARALYFLFKELFKQDPKHKLSDGSLPSVQKASLVCNGSKLVVYFPGWDTSQLASQLADLLEDLPNAAKAFEIQRNQLTGQKLAFHVLNLLKCLFTNRLGFGTPGALWMERDTLCIRGTE